MVLEEAIRRLGSEFAVRHEAGLSEVRHLQTHYTWFHPIAQGFVISRISLDVFPYPGPLASKVFI